MYQIDLNCDLGESFGRYALGMDEKVLPYISSANIACGYHASDPVIMEKTVQLACKNGVSVGAHIGFPDLLGFGRRDMKVSFGEAKTYTMYQIGALHGFCMASKIRLSHVKPHGALYNMAAKDLELSSAICEGIASIDSNITLLGLCNSQMEVAANAIGIPFKQEVFADRAYEDDGSLVDRRIPGAVIQDEKEAVKRVLKMIKKGSVMSIHGKEVELRADSVCVHGDSEKALEFVKLIHSTLIQEGIAIKAF